MPFLEPLHPQKSLTSLPSRASKKHLTFIQVCGDSHRGLPGREASRPSFSGRQETGFEVVWKRTAAIEGLDPRWVN